MVDWKLSGKKILVTGASSGIGRALCCLLSQSGASVILCGRNESNLRQTIDMMDDSYKHRFFCCDLKESEKMQDLFEFAAEDGKKLDGMVHCAGIARAVPLRVMKQADIWDMFQINFVSLLELVKLYSKKKYSDGGSIVAVSAANVHYPQKCMSIYAASKAAVEGAVRSLAVELASKNIRINYIIPGAVKTPMMNNLSDDVKATVQSRQLLGAVTPAQAANSAAYLLSDAAEFITGRGIYVDGGLLGQQE